MGRMHVRRRTESHLLHAHAAFHASHMGHHLRSRRVSTHIIHIRQTPWPVTSRQYDYKLQCKKKILSRSMTAFLYYRDYTKYSLHLTTSKKTEV